jgi:hypothetical protein
VPGWGELRRILRAMVLAADHPHPPRRGDLPPQGGGERASAVSVHPPLEGEGRSKAPGWGDLRQYNSPWCSRWITPTRRFAATSPLKGEVEGSKQQAREIHPPLEGEGRSKAPGWGDLRQYNSPWCSRWITPTRRFAATSPLKGEVEGSKQQAREIHPPLEGEGRSKAPGWGDLRHILRTMALAVGHPHPPRRGDLPPQGGGERAGRVTIHPPLEGEGRHAVPGWGDLRHIL